MIPDHLQETERALRSVCRRVRLLGSLSPANFGEEVARLEGVWQSGGRDAPRFLYRPEPDLDGVVSAAREIASRMSGGGELAELYVERARELEIEAEIVAARGTTRVAAIAKRRFEVAASLAEEADALAERWLAEGEAEGADAELVRTDDAADPRSLLSRAQKEVGRLRLPVRLVVTPSLAPLAAAGDRLLQIGAGRRGTVTDIERTVLHEVYGHLLPMHRAERGALALFETGSARGSEGQEGYALLLESRAGYLRGTRARELALRHIAARFVHGGGTFADTVVALQGRAAPLEQAIRIAARAHRGGGLAREAGYIPAFVSARAAAAKDEAIEHALACGRFSVPAAEVLVRLGAVTSLRA